MGTNRSRLHPWSFKKHMREASAAGKVNASKVHDITVPIYRLMQMRRLKGETIEVGENQTEQMGEDITPARSSGARSKAERFSCDCTINTHNCFYKR